MKRVLWSLFGLIFLAGMAGCAGDIPISEEKPTPEVVALQVTPAVAHWLPVVAECAEASPILASLPRFSPGLTYPLQKAI
jgi:hypothetical protein